ncbi:alpha/beta hydrolase [Sphingomonas sp. CGMCC 1.13654]|uniref:Alpha/beta hydrolase n=1 Tax=Sphingomonas chungangi TaxID=2683589 RepID=A0A838L9S0_9SPHN|nr:alpha/beta hydrolase [Sphingomonas chungangi]MBA2936173.1 alpha/beta hydrolase [Sphingomonas chungangi]MVW55559.1 prolyl oligopeptidase family serine peptidase [Sphingomonas chungangi]
MAGGTDVIDRRALIGSAVVAGVAGPLLAQQPAMPAWPPKEAIRLWPSRPPGAGATLPRPDLQLHGTAAQPDLQLRGVADPTLYVLRPARPNGIGLLTIPGGGYAYEAVSHEGLDVAKRFGALGYTIFLLAYRLPGDGWQHRSDVPLQDAQRAIRLIRAGARGFGVDPARVGTLGFSAGGHLAASLTTAYNEAVYVPVDAADRLPARPDFSGLIYAVTTLRMPGTHPGSRALLLGPDASPQLIDHRSPVLHVDARTPPCFLLQAFDDTVVPPSCSEQWLAACRAHDVSVEAHLIRNGGHGFGVSLPDSNPGSLWPLLFDRWARGLLA